MTLGPLKDRFARDWEPYGMLVFLGYSNTLELPDMFYNHVCFAPLNKPFPYKYVFYKDDRLTQKFPDIIDPYYAAVYELFPHVHPYQDTHGLWYFDLDNYNWHPSEFIYCASLLRYPIELPQMMCSYSEWLKWGATPSQAILAAQYFNPAHWSDWNLGVRGHLVPLSRRYYGGHAVTLNVEEPTSLFGFDIPTITKQIREKSPSVILGKADYSWQGAVDYVKTLPVGPISKDINRTKEEFKLLLQPTFGKQNATYYTL